jgi:histidinol dehydrogenase
MDRRGPFGAGRARHRPAQAILITDDGSLADAVERAVEGQLRTLPRSSVRAPRGAISARFIWSAHSTTPCADRGRHRARASEIATHDPKRLAQNIRNAGRDLSWGAHTPEGIGDYVAGLSNLCPDRGRHAFLRLGRARFIEAHLDPAGSDADALASWDRPAIALGGPKGSTRMPLSVAMRLNRR